MAKSAKRRTYFKKGDDYMTATLTKVKDKSKMEELLASSHMQALPKAGDLVVGKVLYVGKNEILIDLGGVATGVVRGLELVDESGELENLKVNDEVQATVLDQENEKGMVELSFRIAGHQKAWTNLKELKDKKEVVMVKVMEANRGGLIIKLGQIYGFLPVSQLSSDNYPRVEGGNKQRILDHLKSFVGKEIKAKVFDVSEEEEKLIVSEKEVESEKVVEKIKKYKVGDVVKCKITGIVDFGSFVELADGIEGLIHISELAWQRIDDPRLYVKIGQEVEAQIIGIESDRVSLSIKRLQNDPWQNIKDKYKIGDTIKGQVLKLNNYGAFVEIEPNIQALAHVSGIIKNKEERIEDVVKIGETYEFVIKEFIPHDHQMRLVLKDIEVAK